MSFGKKSQPMFTAPKPSAPDFSTLWKTYAGWMDNINTRNKGELAAVRARLHAQGASPDVIKMQSEHLESQRTEALAELKKTTTYSLLQEGYAIATGSKDNPYSSLGGLKALVEPVASEDIRGPRGFSPPDLEAAPGTRGGQTLAQEETAPALPAMPSFEDYFANTFGAATASKAAAPKPSAAAPNRLTPGGPGGAAMPNPWLNDDSNITLV